MSRSVTFRRSLLTNLMMVIVLLSGAIILTTFVGSRQAVKTISRSMIGRSLDEARSRLEQFFEPVIRELALVRSWGASGLLDLDDPARLRRLFEPLMAEHPQVSTLLVADGGGREFMLLRIGDRWLQRETRRDEWGNRVRIEEWEKGAAGASRREQELDYDPRSRPWFRGAVERRDQPRPEAGDPDEDVHWTEPYTFFTTKELGITASVTFDVGDGGDHVVGFDILLDDISAYTTGLVVGERGKLFVLTDDERVVGLPSDPRFEKRAGRQAALLMRPEELGVPVLVDAVRLIREWPAGRWRPRRFESEGEPWWGRSRRFRLTSSRFLRIGVVVPEADLLGGLRMDRTWIVLITLVVLLVAVLQAVALSRRYSRPIEALARQSERIRRGMLEPGAPLQSSVREVRRLAEAHDRMRESLQSLLRLEGDLQLARQIQQSTFPERLPRLQGFEICAWSEPADETGGDSYDVIGLPVDRDRPDEAERAILLLADATGHGIGPALSVTQIRAMLRMAARVGAPLEEIAHHLNDQLHADLHAGRFITAWLGELSAADHTLRSFSAGQAPILRYIAAEDDFDVRAADTIPFGIVDGLQFRIADPFPMLPGDIVAVISDGILEAGNAERRQFGADRAMAIIRTHRGESPEIILRELREAVGEFTGGVPPSDDRTAIVIKRAER